MGTQSWAVLPWRNESYLFNRYVFCEIWEPNATPNESPPSSEFMDMQLGYLTNAIDLNRVVNLNWATWRMNLICFIGEMLEKVLLQCLHCTTQFLLIV